MKKISPVALAVFVLIFVFMTNVQAQSPQQTLNQYVADLQKNPDDNALRERIIKLVQEMKQKPAISREAERFMNRGAAAVKSAKDANDFKDAVAEFEKATMAAPWLANAYYNLGVAQDKAGLYAAAIRSLKLYVLAEPNAPDIRSVEKLIDEIEYKQEKAAKDKELTAKKAVEDKRARQEDAGANKAKEQEEFLRKINGARYIYRFWGKRSDTGADAEYLQTLDVRGDTISMGQGLADGRDWFMNRITYKIEGRTLRCFVDGKAMPQGDAIISEDGNTINLGGSNVYKRLR